jgi:hypothetical protein
VGVSAASMRRLNERIETTLTSAMVKPRAEQNWVVPPPTMSRRAIELRASSRTIVLCVPRSRPLLRDHLQCAASPDGGRMVGLS